MFQMPEKTKADLLQSICNQATDHFGHTVYQDCSGRMMDVPWSALDWINHIGLGVLILGGIWLSVALLRRTYRFDAARSKR